MKKYFLFLIAMLGGFVLSLAEMNIYVYQKDGTIEKYEASAVDSIGFVDVTPPEAVDLGLPSGTKWANMNVGANKPEDFGDYFAWGETTTKSTYNSSTYKWCNGSYDTMTKYCTSSSYGTVDNKTTLELSDDAAYVNWGTSWRMPTRAELDELSNTSYTTWTWTTQNGVSGYKVTSKVNGNSIFLPAAGYRYNSDLYNAGSCGKYWSSSLNTLNSNFAFNLDFKSDNVYSNNFRDNGQSIRPVLADVHTITFNANGGEGNMDVFYVKDGESVTLPANTFTNGLSTFIGWNTAADGTGTAYADKGTVKPTANITLYAQWKNATTGVENGHEWVDLGLPSGTKWATMNVGADSPEDYGDYFAWGETESKSIYNWETYKWSNGGSSYFTKYNTKSGWGVVDDKKTLELSDDVARSIWGGAWRMPTKEELEELLNAENCKWETYMKNGVEGIQITSKLNDQQIFLPLAGYTSSSFVSSSQYRGYYWSSTLVDAVVDQAYCIMLPQNTIDGENRCYGLSVRPVLR